MASVGTTSGEQYNYDIVRKFVIMALIWGVVGMLVGVYIASELAFPGQGKLPDGMAELARIQRENERLRAEVEILKKAISIFGKGPQ